MYKRVVYRMNNISDIEAMKKWNGIPKDIQNRLVGNVYCRECGVTTIIDYVIQNSDYGIILKGMCAHCGLNVARVIENN